MIQTHIASISISKTEHPSRIPRLHPSPFKDGCKGGDGGGLEVRSCLERIGPRMFFFTLYQYVIDSYVNPFALDTLPVRLSQRCGDIPRSRSFPVPYGEKAPFRSAFSCGPEQVCFPDARPSGGLPPSSGIIKMP